MEEESEKLNSPVTKLLVRSRLDLEPEFAGGKRKKSVLWGKVVENMRIINPEVSQTKEFMQRKFLNLFATYKRIKKRNDATGRGATTWEYFKDFDNVFGNRHSIEPPIRNLQSSLQYLVESGVSEEEKSVEESDAEGVSRRKRPKTIAYETLDFFKEEARKEQIRHEETMKIEKEKLLVDKESIKAMLDLRQVLEELCQK